MGALLALCRSRRGLAELPAPLPALLSPGGVRGPGSAPGSGAGARGRCRSGDGSGDAGGALGRGRERPEETAGAGARVTGRKPALLPHREPLEGASRGRDVVGSVLTGVFNQSGKV